MRNAPSKFLSNTMHNLVSLYAGTQGTNSISLFREFEQFFQGKYASFVYFWIR